MMSYSWSLCLLLCLCAYSLAAMAGSIFTASCICAIASTSCILAGALHLHHEYAWHIYRSSFYLFWGQPCRVHLVRTAIFVPHITPVRTICTAAPVNSYFLVLPPLVVCFLWHRFLQIG
jgi:hypothetical protein